MIESITLIAAFYGIPTPYTMDPIWVPDIEMCRKCYNESAKRVDRLRKINSKEKELELAQQDNEYWRLTCRYRMALTYPEHEEPWRIKEMRIELLKMLKEWPKACTN